MSLACCATPTGESPVPVGVGAPGSRPQVLEGDLCARAGRQKPAKRREPHSGEQARGPQHEVKPAAWTDLQPAGRAAHVTAKATPLAREPKRAGGCGGVWGAARVQGVVWNTRDPSARPESGQARSYKPKAKSRRAQCDDGAGAAKASGQRWRRHVLDADIENYFGSIEHDKLLTLVGQRVSARRVPKLVRLWLQAGVMEDGVVSHPVAGTPQGRVISPLLSNIYLHVLDRLGLKLHAHKTRRVVLSEGREGFDFLGCHMHKRMSGRLGAVLRYGQRGEPLHRCGRLRAPATQEPAGQTRGAQPAGGSGTAMGPRILRKLWIASPARDDPLPGQTSWQQECRVMLRADRPLVSRVREIRTHGLKGGVGSLTGLRAT